MSQETTHSFRVSWQPAPGDVTYYRLSYHPLEGEELQGMEVTTSGPETTVVLTELLPQTTYRVTVTPEYQSGPGEPLEVDGSTREGQQIFQNPTCRGQKRDRGQWGTILSLGLEPGELWEEPGSLWEESLE